MVEHKEDKLLACGKIISNKKWLSWEALKLALDVSELTKSVENFKYSWDNLQSDNERIMARLDMVYDSNYFQGEQSSNISSYAMKGNGV
jgi:dimeric dUTPase (all-alpha-NTP-PPase superfamily)